MVLICVCVCVRVHVLKRFVLRLYSLLYMFVLLFYICMDPLENKMGHLKGLSRHKEKEKKHLSR